MTPVVGRVGDRYVEGRTVVIENRDAAGDLERLPALAAELVALKVDVIVAADTPATLAVKTATKTVPVVFTAAGDPVGSGLVTSLRDSPTAAQHHAAAARGSRCSPRPLSVALGRLGMRTRTTMNTNCPSGGQARVCRCRK